MPRGGEHHPARVDRLLDRHWPAGQRGEGRRVEVTAGSVCGGKPQVTADDGAVANEQVPLPPAAAVDLQGHALPAIAVLGWRAKESVETFLDVDRPLDRLIFQEPKVLLDGVPRHAHQQVVIHLGAGQVRQGPHGVGQVERGIVPPVGAVDQHLVVEQLLVGGDLLLAGLFGDAMGHELPNRILHHALEQLDRDRPGRGQMIGLAVALGMCYEVGDGGGDPIDGHEVLSLVSSQPQPGPKCSSIFSAGISPEKRKPTAREVEAV